MMMVFKNESDSDLFLHMPRYCHRDDPYLTFNESDEVQKGPSTSTPYKIRDFNPQMHRSHDFQKIHSCLDKPPKYHSKIFRPMFKKYWIKSLVRILFLFVMMFLLIVLLLIIPPSFEAPLVLEKQKARKIFYLINVDNFQDADGDGVGDLSGVTKALPDIKELGVTHIILSSIPEEQKISGNIVYLLGELVLQARYMSMRILWDATEYAATESTYLLPREVDGFYFSATIYEKLAQRPVTEGICIDHLELTVAIHRAVQHLGLIWYAEVEVPNYEEMKKLKTKAYRHSTMEGMIFRVKIEQDFMRRMNIIDKQFFYIYFLQQVHKIQQRFVFEDWIYYVDSDEKDNAGNHLYVHFWAMMAYSRFPILLKSGQEFEKGVHQSKNYAQSVAEIKKSGKKSYITYLKILNNVVKDQRIRKSTRSSILGSMNNTFIWVRRRIPHTNQAVYAFALLEDRGDEELRKMRSKMTIILDHNKPLEKQGDDKITQMALYIGVLGVNYPQDT
ncbi:hypothetical protein RF11_12646 [Thelohanellus kitauei]|uniref:Glycosyl hydrolase family 13 catalytic domain-containing protein n=1 Tax=Thelohanellus kitauei TaxID=669202 RepID=A0A0C2JAL8_THEKT|nr:hypothetical protein RF11_12646 [Thelohanellus kitauei]